MSSSPQEPKGFFDGFKVWDFVVIFIVADVMTGSILGILAGTAGAIWTFILGYCCWWLHIYNVKDAIKEGRR